jgi:hypothetical protein
MGQSMNGRRLMISRDDQTGPTMGKKVSSNLVHFRRTSGVTFHQDSRAEAL